MKYNAKGLSNFAPAHGNHVQVFMACLLPKLIPKAWVILMDIFELTDIATNYYNDNKPKKFLPHGWVKFVVTNGTQCVFTRQTYEPAPGEYVFKLETRNFKTVCELFRFPNK